MAGATTPGGTVTFSVYDPNSGITYDLPVQSNGQLNMQNVFTGRDALVFNGTTNFMTTGLSNYAGTNHWNSSTTTQTAARGYGVNTNTSTNTNTSNTIANSQHHSLHHLGNFNRAMATPVMQMTNFEQGTEAEAGDVQVGELIDVNCDPKKDVRCRIS